LIDGSRGTMKDMHRHLIIALTLSFFVSISLASGASAAGRVFVDGWEAGNTNLWDQDDTRNKCNAVTGAADGGVGPRGGAYMVRCNWNGVVAWNDPASYETLRLNSLGFSGGNELFLRFYLRVDNNAKDHPADGAKIWRLAAANDISFWALNFRDGSANGALYNSVGNQIGGTFWGGLSTLSNGQWHKYELYIKNGTTDGIARYWEDGQMQWEAQNVNTSQPGGVGAWAPFYVSSNWSGAPGCCDHDTTNYLYWDDFEVFSDTGTGGSGSMSAGTITQGASDTTPPAAPTGLGVE